MRTVSIVGRYQIPWYFFCKWCIVAFLHVGVVSVMCVYMLVLCAVIAMQSRRVYMFCTVISVC